MRAYRPSLFNRDILEAAIDHIQSVPYNVSLRWVFYRLLQDGYYSKKESYTAWKSLASVARKRSYDRWAPDTLTDETRAIDIRNGGYHDEWEARDLYLHDLAETNPVFLDHFTNQEEVVFICFEARAMHDQFRHYTIRLDLVPFGGDPSIPLKWKVAKHIEALYDLHMKPIRILYFGDYDKKGLQIADSAIRDVSAWCEVDFELTPCGLTLDQALEFGVPENPDKPGEFQWEALDDDAAGTIIKDAIGRYVDEETMYGVFGMERELTIEFKEKIESIKD